MADEVRKRPARTAIVLISDRGYLVPTIGAALSARAHTSDAAVQVLVLLTASPVDEVEAVRACTAPFGVTVRAAEIAGLEELQAERYGPAHVSATTMVRLWLDELLEPSVERFLYLDGDIDIVGSLDPLLAQDIPRGGFLAAPDASWLIRSRIGAMARSKLPYLEALRVRPDQYFNAGVLLAERAGWAAIGRTARDFFARHRDLCRWQDQSALNATAGHLRGELSPVWNYQTEFMAVGDPRRWGCAPRIWHFTDFPKPWQAHLHPWTDPAFGADCRQGAALLAGIGISLPEPPAERIAQVHERRARTAWRIRWLHGWRRIARARLLRGAMEADRALSRS